MTMCETIRVKALVCSYAFVFALAICMLHERWKKAREAWVIGKIGKSEENKIGRKGG